MVQCIEEIFFKDINKAEEFFNGQMVKYTMDNGLKEKRMGVECGKDLMEILTLENGRKGKFKDLVFLFQRQETDMKENLKIQ